MTWTRICPGHYRSGRYLLLHMADRRWLADYRGCHVAYCRTLRDAKRAAEEYETRITTVTVVHPRAKRSRTKGQPR